MLEHEEFFVSKIDPLILWCPAGGFKYYGETKVVQKSHADDAQKR